MRRVSCVSALLVSLGCDGGDPQDVVDTDMDTTGAAAEASMGGDGDDSTPEPGSTSSASPSTTSGIDETSSTGADASSSGPDGPPPPDYATPHFPLQVGLQWRYRLTRTDRSLGGDCRNDGAEHVMTITDESGGVFTRTEDPYCDFASLQFRIEGEFVDVSSGDWYHQLRLPPALDATWPAGGASGASYVWDAMYETHTVEAGTFSDCWRRTQQGYDVWEIYCRDVGMVESHYDAWGSNSRSELVGWGG